MPSISIPVALGIGSAAAGIGGSLLSANAAGSAADKQAAAANRAAEMAQANYAQTRNDLQPFTQAGYDSLRTLQGNLPGYIKPFNPTMADLEATPGYQFTRDQGLQAVQNSASAKGLGISGAALKGAANFATGLADSTYQTQFNIDQANKTNAYTKLLGLVGAGQSSAAQVGGFGQQATQNAGNFLTSGANAQAAGMVGGANALTGGFNNALGGVQNAYYANRLMNQNDALVSQGIRPSGGSYGNTNPFGAIARGGST